MAKRTPLTVVDQDDTFPLGDAPGTEPEADLSWAEPEAPEASPKSHRPKKAPPKAKAAAKVGPKAPPKAKAAAKAPGANKMSALDAAAKILSDDPDTEYSAAELIDAMARKKLWVSPGGATPAATLSSAILREIAKKGPQSRFRKSNPGRFCTSE